MKTTKHATGNMSERRGNPMLSVVVPVYNEEGSMPRLIEQLVLDINPLGIDWELIIVDDGSTDHSLDAVIRESQIQSVPATRILSLSRNFGKEAALSAGLDATQGDVVVPLDADLQDPPSLISQMLAKWKEGYDVVYAIRRERNGETKTKRLTAFLFYRLIRLMSNTPIPADTGDFRLMDRRVVEAISKLPERKRFMKGLFAWVGFRQVGIYYTREERCQGSTNWNYWKLVNFAIDGITSFSQMPLKIISTSGFFIAAGALSYGFLLAARTIVLGIDIPGYASLITAVLFLGGVQLIALGLLGEYIGRIFEETKQRPLYIVREDIRIRATPH